MAKEKVWRRIAYTEATYGAFQEIMNTVGVATMTDAIKFCVENGMVFIINMQEHQQVELVRNAQTIFIHDVSFYRHGTSGGNPSTDEKTRIERYHVTSAVLEKFASIATELNLGDVYDPKTGAFAEVIRRCVWDTSQCIREMQKGDIVYVRDEDERIAYMPADYFITDHKNFDLKTVVTMIH